MKKIYLSLLGMLLLGVQLSFAQKDLSPNKKNISNVLNLPTAPISQASNSVGSNGYIADRCGYVTQFNKAVTAGYNINAFESIINRKIEEIKAARANGTARFANYVIPVVFHIIHDGTAEGTGANLSASQVYQQIDQLNKDYSNLSGSPFAVAADAGITFCPVTVDPNGNTLAQAGINRINRTTTGWTDPLSFTDQSNAGINTMINYIDANIKPASIWDPTRYVNIWAYNFANSGLLGYATFPTAGLPDLPSNGETATTAGCVFLSGSLGGVASPGTANPYALGRTVGHEIGHFLGLYHTWGNATSGCGATDYCDDTPACSAAYFSTVPTCTAPTQCGNTRMIQNYMDYSDDGCMNTFTQNQVDRMQAVMLSSPRRPANSGLCTPPVSNALNFITAATAASENSLLTTCPKYNDYTIAVKPSVAANGNTTVNFNFSGTATQGSDYSIIGSSTLNYTNGDGATKSFTIRVFDDGAVESTETIIINYTITNAGLVNGTTSSHTVTIVDNDINSSINNTNIVSTLFTENFGTTANAGALPTGWIKGSFATPAGNNVWTVNSLYGASTGFTTVDNGRVLHITNGNASSQTSETADALYSAASSSDAIAVTPSINTTGFKNIKVTFDYAVLGEFDVDGIYDFGLMRYSTSTQTTGLAPVTGGPSDTITIFYNKAGKSTITVTLPAATANAANLWIGFEWINDNNTRGLPPFIIDNIVVTGEKVGVETVSNQLATTTQNSGHTVQYISSSNKIIATITNLNQNVGCITASVTNSGTGMLALNTNTGSYQRSEKVIQVSPAVANTTATYQATFYFTTAELAIWGANVPNLKIMKVTDGTSLSSTLNTTNSAIFTPVVNDLRATAGYASFTINATGGFSQFFLASQNVVLPINLLSFEARPNGKNILLNWSTATEYNNKGFVIERSNNGTSFERIGWVDGAINSSRQTNYSYADNFVQPDKLYYYRLRQADMDSRESLSEIRSAKIKGNTKLLVTISPNPAKGQLKVFTTGANTLSDINLYDAKGQLIQSWKKVNCTATPYQLNVGNIAAGVYMMQIVSGNISVTEKLIIN